MSRTVNWVHILFLIESSGRQGRPGRGRVPGDQGGNAGADERVPAVAVQAGRRRPLPRGPLRLHTPGEGAHPGSSSDNRVHHRRSSVSVDRIPRHRSINGERTQAIQAAVGGAFRTPEVIRLFAGRRPGELRQRLAQLQRDLKLAKVSAEEAGQRQVSGDVFH